ncbi:MAG TPA: ATP-binding cassette domain-containing protein [Acidimicrobiales bacterium]|nr:ATP-binding cassette domain-containing protein [Acidimicrobiales bacterium]
MTPPADANPDAGRSFARLLGASLALWGLALALLSARAVVWLAEGRVTSGLVLLGVVVLGRLLGAEMSEAWTAYAAARLRHRYRRVVTTLMVRPRREGERGRSDLAHAIEDVSSLPALDVLSASARVASLGLVVLFWAAGLLPLAIVLALLGVAVPLYLRAGRRANAMDADFRARRNVLESRQLELISHAPDLRALGAVAYGANEIAAISDSEHVIVERAVRVSLSSSLVTEFLAGVSVGLVAMVVGFGLLDGRITLLRALIAVLVTAELFGHVRRYGVAFHRREDVTTARAVLDACDTFEITSAGTLLDVEALTTHASDARVDLRVERGDRVLVTGPSGSGKTTLLHTLIGWTAPREGVVRRGAAPIAYVSAESPLLSQSLWDNLTLGEAHERDDVRALLVRLGLDTDRFADLDLRLDADGRGLSSGERVRLVLARTLLARPALILLDDVAGVLDVANRELVSRLLNEHADVAIIEATVDAPLLDAHQVVMT